MTHRTVQEVTDRVAARSARSRAAYLSWIRAAGAEARAADRPAVAVVTSYGDPLSALWPDETCPAALQEAVWRAGGVARPAGGVPALCDGLPVDLPGMAPARYGRDAVAMATATALSPEGFDAALLLGACDTAVPGLLIGALHFGHLPAILVPGPPAGRDGDRSPGACACPGAAGPARVLVEVMGLHLPGAAFAALHPELGEALTRAAARRAVQITARGAEYTPVGEVVDERAIVNAVVALLATGGAADHTPHLVAVAAAAGIKLTWDDLADLAEVVPLLTRTPRADRAEAHRFRAAGGVPALIGELLDAGLLHDDVLTVAGRGLDRYRAAPALRDGELVWEEPAAPGGDPEVLRPVAAPFSPAGGIRVVSGNLGRAVGTVSAVRPEHLVTEAPALVFDDQLELLRAFETGRLDGRDFVAVVRYQGPRAHGGPGPHPLASPLGALLDRGQRVAIVTDGRTAEAYGQVPAAIHLSPEAAAGGPIALVRNGDPVRLDLAAGTLQLLVSEKELAARTRLRASPSDADWAGLGRELFPAFRRTVGPAERGAGIFALNGGESDE